MSQHLPPQASESADGFNSIALLFILLIGVVVVISLIGYLGSSVARREQRPPGHRLWLRAGCILSVCAAICVYMWGALHVLFMEDMNMRQACVAAGGEARASTVDGYEASYIPLRFTCRISEGGSYTAAIPPWINPALSGLVGLGLITGVASGITRDDFKRDNVVPSQQKRNS
ncbi:hypothetical protein OIE43_19125 [Streptomyces pseudovenezuelae]|uniref:Uncharacterized protein n=1 Tax=Streptomyces pseudovenezuelae TaxID=67350 RepID=A0A124HA05_9ACTN|nr:MULTISPECIES: hypothetical protein [Streptomyces]KUM86601.1 hypothetical protein AQI94_21325 [Streptomyces pseudovenezuelae]